MAIISSEPHLDLVSQSIPVENKYIHGSPDSRDLDIAYKIHSESAWPLHKDLVAFCNHDSEDRNVFQLGLEHVSITANSPDTSNSSMPFYAVQKCFRGIPDEVNNALLSTARCTDSSIQTGISGKVRRCVLVRLTVAAKSIITKLRRQENCRKLCVAALHTNNFSNHVGTLEAILKSWVITDLTCEIAKYITFHLCQSYALMIHGTELYTKATLVEHFPKIHSLIYFEKGENSSILNESMIQLESIFSQWLDAVQYIISVDVPSSFTHLQRFTLNPKRPSNLPLNFAELECNGTIIDMESQRVVLLSPSISFPNFQTKLIVPTWPSDLIETTCDKEYIILTLTMVELLSEKKMSYQIRLFQNNNPIRSKNKQSSNEKGTKKQNSHKKSQAKITIPDEFKDYIKIKHCNYSFIYSDLNILQKIISRDKVTLRAIVCNWPQAIFEKISTWIQKAHSD